MNLNHISGRFVITDTLMHFLCHLLLSLSHGSKRDTSFSLCTKEYQELFELPSAYFLTLHVFLQVRLTGKEVSDLAFIRITGKWYRGREEGIRKEHPIGVSDCRIVICVRYNFRNERDIYR